MKSLNTKKIAALAAGAALLGGALLGAGTVSFGNTELVNTNGQVMAKVVVGDAAKASDGVAAANIAAVLGNKAFKSVEVTASPTGLEGLSCEAGAGAGTCEILSKSVTLEVETPAGTIPAGAYGFTTLINDFIDSNLENRDNTLASDLDDSPWGLARPSHKIGASKFSPLESYTVTDPQSSIKVAESQYIYVEHSGANERVFYDDDKSALVAERVQVAYELEFADAGLPVCSDVNRGSWAYCKYSTTDADTNKQLENHRVKVRFLGEDWIISEMNAVDNGAAPAVNTEINGGSIKLAKESAYSPKLQIGEGLDLGDGNTLVLGDLKPASGGQANDIAIFSIKNAAGEEIANQVVAAGATTEITAGSSTYRVRVYQVAPGYTLTEKWAEVAVFSNELELTDGEELDDNEEWDVSLIWKDKTLNTATDGSEDFVDHLFKVQLMGASVSKLYEGDSIDIVDDPAKFRLTFQGLNLKDSDYISMSATIESSGADFRWIGPGDAYNADTHLYTTGNQSLTRENDIVLSTRASDTLFRGTDLGGQTFNTKELRLSPAGYYNTTGSQQYNNSILLFKDGTRLYPVASAANTVDVAPFELNYEVGGKRYNAVFNLGIWDATNAADERLATSQALNTTLNATRGQVNIVRLNFTEDAGNSQTDSIILRAVEKDSATFGELVFDAIGSNTQDNHDEVRYVDVSATERSYKLPYVTERGSEVDGGKTSMTVKFAKEVGKAQFLLQSVGVGTAAGEKYTQTLSEGETLSLADGTKVNVKAINVETGPCSATGATVTGTDGISCELNAVAANLGERQNVPSDLVVLDSDAASYETVIAVGGPFVNTITEAILSGTGVELEQSGQVVVQEVARGKIVVAGYSAQDTLTATQQFIAQLMG